MPDTLYSGALDGMQALSHIQTMNSPLLKRICDNSFSPWEICFENMNCWYRNVYKGQFRLCSPAIFGYKEMNMYFEGLVHKLSAYIVKKIPVIGHCNCPLLVLEDGSGLLKYFMYGCLICKHWTLSKDYF